MSPQRRATLLRILSLILVVAIMVGIYLFRDHLQDLSHYGYLGIYLVTLIANATVFLPIPGVAFVFAMGSVLHPALTAIFAGAGAATGELSGYLLGFSGQGLAESSARYERILAWMTGHRKLTDLAILVMAAIPNPFFDLAGIAAGTLRIPLWRFLVFCTAGSIIKMLVFAYAGELGFGWLTAWYHGGK
jgi:uncharacterized membrane protein YdjX (TVP38/TMEM64 family)